MLVLLLAACGANPESLPASEPGLATDTLTTAADSSLTIPEPEHFAGVDTNQRAKILQTYLYHNDEIWPGVENEKWYGIYADPDYTIRATAVYAEQAFDQISDEEGEKTGWEITQDHEIKPILLIGGMDFEEKKLDAIAVPETLLPGDTARFVLAGISYLLYATGTTTPDPAAPDYPRISNYKLFLSAEKNGRQVHQLLIAHPHYSDDYAQPGILFCGDLDGDNTPDLVIENSTYNKGNPMLFLSGNAGEDQLLQLAGWHESYGC